MQSLKYFCHLYILHLASISTRIFSNLFQICVIWSHKIPSRLSLQYETLKRAWYLYNSRIFRKQFSNNLSGDSENIINSSKRVDVLCVHVAFIASESSAPHQSIISYRKTADYEIVLSSSLFAVSRLHNRNPLSRVSFIVNAHAIHHGALWHR